MKELLLKIERSVSLQTAKNPEKVLIFFILILNVVLVFGSAALLVLLFPQLSGGSFWKTSYNVFTMILDAGCISELVNGRYSENPALPLICIAIILLGTLIFTGAIIGYLTNRISNYISEANKGRGRLLISDHIVIVNWNNRASEIINDLLYSDEPQKVVVLVSKEKERIQLEIENRIADTVEREKAALAAEADMLIEKGLLDKRAKRRYIKEKYQINKISVIVREGEVYSLKQLNDISVSTAKNIIILSKNNSYDICKYQNREFFDKIHKGNIETIKTLVQISDITSSEASADNQKVVVEVEDDWTMELVKKIITHKQRRQKCNIIPVPVNKILGQILSQFSVMPELNAVYSELFSNKGSTFYSRPFKQTDENKYFSEYLLNHDQALPITTMETESGRELFYIANREDRFDRTCSREAKILGYKLNPDFRFPSKHIAILGHNSRFSDIIEGFRAFITEWDKNKMDLIDILIIDDEDYLEKVNGYKDYLESKEYGFIKTVLPVDIYDAQTVQNAITQYIDSHPEDTSVLILSDDYAIESEIDSKALTYLVYLQDIVYKKSIEFENFDPQSIDIIVELLNPKNYDVVKSYSVNNIIISNRYISRMLVQVGEKESIYEFYKDILTYDTDVGSDKYESKELYIKNAEAFFGEDVQFPIKAEIRDFVTSVYYASPEDNKSIVLGIVNDNMSNILFTESKNNTVEINRNNKLILFSPH